MARFKTIEEAVKHWVRGMNTIPTSVVELVRDSAEVNSEEFESVAGDHSDYSTNGLPAWGWMWTFEESLDEDFFRENPEILEQCGFVAYDTDQLGLIIGVDGAGYDFYAEHWIPLYKARGLQWHEQS